MVNLYDVKNEMQQMYSDFFGLCTNIDDDKKQAFAIKMIASTLKAYELEIHKLDAENRSYSLPDFI